MTGSGSEQPLVLVVEDDPLLRMMAVDIVEDAGFAAVEATDATQAIAILESRPDIRIVFTDIDMPRGMDGLTLALKVRDRWPPIELIITSGKLHPAAGELPSRGVFLSKPYDEVQLVATMRQLAG